MNGELWLRDFCFPLQCVFSVAKVVKRLEIRDWGIKLFHIYYNFSLFTFHFSLKSRTFVVLKRLFA